ncbi:MAG: MlaD family protein [Candidatus Binatia bacterium]
MSKQASPTLIGGFVVGALVLLVAGVLVFGSGKFFTETRQAVLYFTGDIKGLRTGASVDFRGVQIGTVSEIRAVLDTHNVQVRIPVIVEIVGDKLQWVGEEPDPEVMMQKLVEEGVRAQLQLESMVTGQLFIQFDFHPEAPAQTLVVDPLTQLPEIPTIPTTMQQAEQIIRKALEKLGDIPLEQIITRINTTLQSVEQLMTAPEIKDAVRSLSVTMTEVQDFVRHLNTQLVPVTTGATEALGSVTNAMGNVGHLARSMDGQVATLTGSLTETMGAARIALENAQETLKGVNGVMTPTSPVGYELVKTLRELSEAARALRVLADYLERNPNAILFGKSEAGAQ